MVIFEQVKNLQDNSTYKRNSIENFEKLRMFYKLWGSNNISNWKET